jgi:hypothetical protein
MMRNWVNGVERYEASQGLCGLTTVSTVLAGKARMVRFKCNGSRQDTEGFIRLFIRPVRQSRPTTRSTWCSTSVFLCSSRSRRAVLQMSAAADELRNTGNVTLTVMTLEEPGCAGPVPVTARISPGQKLATTRRAGTLRQNRYKPTGRHRVEAPRESTAHAPHPRRLDEPRHRTTLVPAAVLVGLSVTPTTTGWAITGCLA